MHEWHGFGSRTQEGEQMLELCSLTRSVATTTVFTVRASRLVKNECGILVRKITLNFVEDAKLVSGKECTLLNICIWSYFVANVWGNKTLYL